MTHSSHSIARPSTMQVATRGTGLMVLLSSAPRDCKTPAALALPLRSSTHSPYAKTQQQSQGAQLLPQEVLSTRTTGHNKLPLGGSCGKQAIPARVHRRHTRDLSLPSAVTSLCSGLHLARPVLCEQKGTCHLQDTKNGDDPQPAGPTAHGVPHRAQTGRPVTTRTEIIPQALAKHEF